MKYYPKRLIDICICGHGMIHHSGKFGECTCDTGQYKDQKICRCPNYKQNLNDFRNVQIIEWNKSLDFTLLQESNKAQQNGRNEN